MKKIKRKLIAELAKMSVKAAHLTDSELLKAFEETLTLSKKAIYAYDDKAESLLKPVYNLIRDEIDNRICSPNCNYVNHEFDNEFVDILYNVDAQYSDHMRIRYFNEIIIDYYAIKPEAFDAMIEQLEKDAAAVEAAWKMTKKLITNVINGGMNARHLSNERLSVLSNQIEYIEAQNIKMNQNDRRYFEEAKQCVNIVMALRKKEETSMPPAADNGFNFDLQAHSDTVEAAPVEEGNPSTVKINQKMAMLAELAALPAKPECLTNDELLKAIERVHKASITAAYDFDRIYTSDEKEFICNVDRALKAAASQRKIDVYEEIGDAIFRIDDELLAEKSNRLIIASQWRYMIKPEAFDAMIEQLEKDAAAVDSNENIFPDPADIEPNMIVPTLAQAVEWRLALSNIDLTAAYQLAVLTHSKMTILTKDRWLVEECLNAFEEEARNRGVNILPLDTVDRFKFNLQNHADDETEKALDYIVDGIAQSYFKLTHIEEEGVDTHCNPSNKLAALNVIHMHAMYKFAVKHGEIALADQYLYQIDRFLKVIGIDRVNTKTNRFKFDLQRHADDETERVSNPEEPGLTRDLDDSELLEMIRIVAFGITILSLTDTDDETIAEKIDDTIAQNQDDLDKLFHIIKKYRNDMLEYAYDEERIAQQNAADLFYHDDRYSEMRKPIK